MKSVNIIASVLLVFILLLATVSFAIAESGSDDSIDDVFTDDSDESSAITAQIDPSEISVSESEIELTGRDFTKKTITRGSGWIVTSGKGALLDIQLVSGYSGDQIFSKGWLKAGNLKFKLESTSQTDDSKKFQITARDGSVRGTLSLNKVKSYQTGFASWQGKIDMTVGNESFNAEVEMALEEKVIGQGKIEDRIKPGYSGGMELGGVYYILNGRLNSDGKIELEISGQSDSNKVKGELVLEKSSDLWVGKIEIEDDSGDNEVKGKATAKLSREGSTLYGPIKVELDGSQSNDLASLEGTIKLVVSEAQRRAMSDDSSSRALEGSSDEGKPEEKSRSNSGKDSSNSGDSQRGLWNKFWNLFGGN